MKETLKKITEEQLDQLREVEGYNDEDIEMFYNILNYNFGEGIVLPFNHVLNMFEKKMFLPNTFRGTEQDENYFGYYIDTYRILELLNRSTDEILEIEKENLIEFHNQLSKDFGEQADNILLDKYNESVSSFKKYNFENENYKVGLIESIEELDWEGLYMNHCIATYRHIVSGGQYIGFKFFNKISWERLTLGCHRKGEVLIFDQLKGHSNYPASQESRKMVMEFCKNNKILFDVNTCYDLFINE